MHEVIMSGQRIDDHSFWAGKGHDGSVFPKGAHNKVFHSAEGDGAVSRYEDTDMAVKGLQEVNIHKMKKHPMKDGYRH